MVKHVILITDGDKYARQAVELTADKLGCRCISRSSGNPTPLTGPQLVEFIQETPYDPILVMFDDCGFNGEGPGEKALEFVATHEDVQPLGAIAVASNSSFHEWSRVDVSIDQFGHLSEYGVDKDGVPDLELGRVAGDTVYVLDRLNLPVIVGVGDIGKVGGFDRPEKGAPVTMEAVKLVMERSGYH
ncbi:stage V sporulation protein AE [Tuberibacillus sp. Marseille-P3662]|uniref:stage V sporulation protein AE n=1 Tax=Tuberibacillus sp. Marseille-P3662 TaxID=1965358 RepID=UPI000A1C7EC7|nr:stage V sporulation protein AE [Tuberibacillus sp. Marseille-P3662]